MKKFILLAIVSASLSAKAQNMIVLQADKGKDVINKNIYIHFAEHLGHCIYGGLYVGDGRQGIVQYENLKIL